MTIAFDEHKKAKGVNDRHHNDAKSSKCSLTETPRHAVVLVNTSDAGVQCVSGQVCTQNA